MSRAIVEPADAPRAYEIGSGTRKTPTRRHRAHISEIGRGARLTGIFRQSTSAEESFNCSGWFAGGDLGRLDEQGCLGEVAAEI
jgi:hypothetical protein